MQRLQNRFVFVRNITQRHGAALDCVWRGKFNCPQKKRKRTPYSSRERREDRKKREREKERERGGEEETPETPKERGRGEREEKREAAAIKQIWTGVRLAGRCGRCEYCGRKGVRKLHGGKLGFYASAQPRCRYPALISICSTRRELYHVVTSW